jgi:hypothetical protein
MIEMTSSVVVFASSDPQFGTCRASPILLLPQGYGDENGDAAFVTLPTAPDHFRSMRSAVSRLPHSHPKEVLSELQAEIGPSSTVLCPHSSHTRMISLEELFTGQPPRYHVQVYLLTFNG